MAINMGLRDEEKKPGTTQPGTTTTPGTTTNDDYSFVIGGVVPNGIAPTPQKPVVNEEPTTPTTPATPAAGGNTGAGVTDSGKTTTSISSLLSSYTGGNNTANKETVTAEQNAKTSLEELRNDYSNILRDQYNYSAERLKKERDDALRENWILQQQAEAALPEQMAASGINGGANATSLANLRAQYQGNRNDIQSGYMDNLTDLNREQILEQAETQKDYNDRWLEYLMSLAEMEAQGKYNK